MATTGEPFGLFWDSENGDRTYSAASFEYWLKKFFTSGVFNGDLQVKAKSGMTLEIDPGYANVDGKVKFWNGAFTVTLDAANSTYPRIDTIIIRRDNVNRQIICEKVTGSYSADTPQPTAPTRNSEIYDLVTAQIYVGAGVTEITQSNITDTRPNNELCGYITGTVEELDFSAFTAQFEAYFAEFKRNQMADFQAWEVAQQAAYAAWFNLVKQQQIQDKADWDAWYAALQEELHELPEDTAEYLQIQIDEIRTSGTTGSILKITTTETSLEGKTVTVTNGTETRTATFDENLECLIAGYKGTGEVTISSSDGIQTATTVVTIPYFGNYQYAIAFWAATVNIQGDDNLKGATITVKDSDDLTVGTVVLNVITGRGVFTAQKADTYTFNFTYQGTDYSESLIVDEQITYSLSLSAGFAWRGWVDTAQFLDSSDYNSLDEVLADEEAVRELCLEHACVDYMAEATSTNEELETVINNDLFAKWVNNSDYALDFLYANAVIADLMDEADKYFYGEWVITDDTTTPPTWGAKGNVPVMTSNSAPYGTAFGNGSYTDYPPYWAFDGDNSTMSSGTASASTSGAYIGYHFANPVCAKRVTIRVGYPQSTQCIIQASNDNITYTDLKEFTIVSSDGLVTVDFENDNYYLYYRIYQKSTTAANRFGTYSLQFYGRELSVSVPIMTSNTTPYGEASASSQQTGGYEAHKAFDNDTNTYWNTQNPDAGINQYITYHFTTPIVPKFMYLLPMYASSAARVKNFTVRGSNDGFVNDSHDLLTDVFPNQNGAKCYELDVSETYSDIRLFVADNWGTADGRYIQITSLQFYGLDYSEKEFEEGTTKKWLYDHGVELIAMDGNYGSSATTTRSATKEDSQIYYPNAGTNDIAETFGISEAMDLTPYSLLRVKDGNKGLLGTRFALLLVMAKKTFNTNVSGNTQYAQLMITTMGNPKGIDISSVNNNAYLGISSGYNCSYTFEELWLE